MHACSRYVRMQWYARMRRYVRVHAVGTYARSRYVRMHAVGTLACSRYARSRISMLNRTGPDWSGPYISLWKCISLRTEKLNTKQILHLKSILSIFEIITSMISLCCIFYYKNANFNIEHFVLFFVLPENRYKRLKIVCSIWTTS